MLLAVVLRHLVARLFTSQSFVRDWFRLVKRKGINTCLDTNGFVRHYNHNIDELLDVTDLVLLDLKKSLNDQVHQNLIRYPINVPLICKIFAKT